MEWNRNELENQVLFEPVLCRYNIWYVCVYSQCMGGHENNIIQCRVLTAET